MPEPTSKNEYDKLKKKLKESLAKKKELDKKLTKLEEDIFNKETKYLSDGINHGNIIKGFENFTKNVSGTSASRTKKIQFTDEDRIFSLSSATYVRHLKKINSGQATGSLNSSVALLDDDMEDADSESNNTPKKKK
ncbi:hypothetical protein CANARDRAFT_22930 [[Candida] arabinofermentans NRRL YB-2248]|uniref:Chromatin modification-related protein EAF6 n=1 Tax=[Candida] arabinofermentans NRRL YB-2248 TaxID=983967 RepID=A0A1E4T0W9_9ASCO|nr:hypothetical protein CANARDRAFT_22930 [[Candida] arabinofermentans NRRL YB-2248]